MIKDITLLIIGAIVGGAGIAISELGQWTFTTTENHINNAGGAPCEGFPKTLKTSAIATYNKECTRPYCRALNFPFTSGEISQMLHCDSKTKEMNSGVNCPIEVTCYVFKDVNQIAHK